MNKKVRFISLSTMILSSAMLHAAPTQGKIDLNHASATELTHVIKGIGTKRAESIIKYRDEHHGFKSIDELSNVSGIGKNFVTKNHDVLDKALSVGP